ncbi:MAG TPA: CPBP family intramembrane glutamic endopeptidase [Candidatus Acidoferrales bacterium]
MTGSHVLLDHILLVMIAVVWPVAEWRWYYPRSVRAIAAGIPGARARLYRNSVAPQWVFTACIISLWVSRARPWTLLMLGPSTPLRLGIALASAALSVVLLPLQRRTLYARPNWPELVRRTLDYAEPLVPRTTGEYRGMLVVALTAGVCEEFLFRGFVTWYFLAYWPGSWLGMALAVIISAILFGFAHIYFGARQVWVSALAGLFFAGVVLAAGSLVPAMIMHAAMDLNSFDLGHRALRKTSESGRGPAVSAAS